MIICVFSTITKGLEKWRKKLDIPITMSLLQKGALFGATFILKRNFGILEVDFRCQGKFRKMIVKEQQ